MLQRFSAMGTNLLVLRPGQRGTGGVMSGTQQNLTVEDCAGDPGGAGGGGDRAGGERQRAGEVPGAQLADERAGDDGRRTYRSAISRWSAARCFSDADTDRMARVAIIGPVTAENLFGAQDPSDQTIKLNGINFRVIGVLKSKGDQGWFNPDDQVLIPYTTAMKQIFGLEYLRRDRRVGGGGDET